MAEQRRLAAILAADMVGYSRLMEADETGTIARQKVHRAELIDPKIAQHNGRIVKTTGDGILVEFPSVVDAVMCAVEIQRAMPDRELDFSENHRIKYRVGINIGDIVIDDDDIFGDGVNVAARLEGLAEPGGICIPRKVFHEVRNKLDVGYEYIGEQKIKNIKLPIPVYRVLLEPAAAGKIKGERLPINARWKIGGITAMILLVMGVGWWMLSSQSDSTHNESLVELLARPGVVVLPLENLSPDPEQSYFATGLTRELTARLTHFANIRVIARNSASRFGGSNHSLREVSQALNAQYVVKGSVRRDAKRVSVTVQLINGETGDHLWSSNYNEPVSAKAIFDIQDTIAARIASSIGGLGGAIRKSVTVPNTARPDDLEAYECVILHYKFWDTFDHKVHAKARECLEGAVNRHPEFALGWAELAYTYWTEFAFGVNPQPDSLSRAKSAAERAIEIDPQMAEGYGALSQTYRSMKMADESAAAAERAFTINPNNVGIIGGAGCMLTFTGRLDRAEVFLDRARALDPFAPWWIPYCKAIWHIQRDNPKAALETLDTYSGKDIWFLGFARIVALVEAGRVDEAKATRDRLLQSVPNYEKKVKPYLEKNFWAQPGVQERLLNALQAAGMTSS